MINNENGHVLTDDEIVKVIIDYVDENLYNYAILIDGEWGCGKTHFIKKYLYEKLEKHENDKNKNLCKPRKIVYISLYGVKSVDEVSKQILMESCLSNTGKAKGILKKGAEITSAMLPILFDIIKTTGLELDSGELKDAAGDLFQVKNSILIFDDLERCNCPINEILGYINTFVEQEEMKVIIVANQKEIGKSTFMTNQELKYLVAAHKNIVFEEEMVRKQDSGTYINTEGKEQEPVKLAVVQSRMDRLFGQDKLYEKVKEKLIGITIFYQPELQKVFTKLINDKIINESLQKLLLNKVSFFNEYMISEKHTNIRTFQFFLSKICGLYEKIQKLEAEGREVFFNYIMEYSFKVCVCYKNSTLEYNWEKNEEYEFKYIGRTYFGGGNLAFRFVDDFIMESILDEKRMKKMFEFYVDEYINPKGDLEGFRKLENSWCLSTDDEVEEQIVGILKDLEENKYEVKEYDRIISIFMILEEVGFSEENTEKAILKMKKNIKKLTYHISLNNGYSFASSEKQKERFNKVMHELQSIIDSNFQKQVSTTIIQYLSMGDGWAEKLVDYVKNNKKEIINNSGFLSQMDMEYLATKIRDSKAYDIQAFRICIMELFGGVIIRDKLKEDGEKIDKLLVEIDKLNKDDFDKIKKFQIKYLIKSLNNVKEFYKN